MSIKTPITVAFGDGIGPDIMAATLRILKAADAQIQIEEVEVGEKIFLQGNTSGIPDNTWKSIKRTHVLLKGPITTPQGGGYKSLNVTLRKAFGLYANVRPCVALHPFVFSAHPDMNLVIIRENEEDLYTGIEHRQTEDTYQCLKLITRAGCERIIQYAFEYARKFNRKKVTCFTKDNIMKMTDGIFHKVFNEIAEQYSDISHDHFIVDIGTALLATEPERFDVIVTSNLYGDIISDVAAQVTGSVGLAGSANIGKEAALFEAIHGSAPDIAGKKIANPSGLLNAAVQMLIHINQSGVASTVQNAWLRTIEEGIHTADIYDVSHSERKVNTDEFADAVIARLGQTPEKFKPVDYQLGMGSHIVCVETKKKSTVKKILVGVDIFIDNSKLSIEAFAKKLSNVTGQLKCQLIMSRGLKIWPDCLIDTSESYHCCCRFQVSKELTAITHQTIIDVLQQLDQQGLDVIKTENLYTFDGQLGFSLAQGQ